MSASIYNTLDDLVGTIGPIMGTSCLLEERCAEVPIVGVQPGGEFSIPGIRKWAQPYFRGLSTCVYPA